MPVNLISPNIVRYANTPGIKGITAGMAKIMGGTCRACAIGMLKMPTTDAPIKDANTTLTENCSKLNFIITPMAPPIHNANKVRGGTLNKIPNPSAAQPLQNALLSIKIHSIIVSSNCK